MTAAAETGRAGERAATEYLRRAGYEICALNWRQGRYELDIVACREGVLHFVEVKTRRSGSLTPPEAAATQRKFRALSRAAACYLRTVGWEGEVQFDLAAAEAAADGSVRLRNRSHRHSRCRSCRIRNRNLHRSSSSPVPEFLRW